MLCGIVVMKCFSLLVLMIVLVGLFGLYMKISCVCGVIVVSIVFRLCVWCVLRGMGMGVVLVMWMSDGYVLNDC